MSVQNQQPVWSVSDKIDSKYEKCRNITEEIYKRINITFQIKKLETSALSDVSDQSEQIDSNELSNETDLFACDKTSISSSTEAERPTTKFVNINNNEEKPKKPVVYKRPRKRFRKRVKKRQSQPRSDTDGSSDEAPLSRIVDAAKEPGAKPELLGRVGLPHVLILAKDLIKPKILLSVKNSRETTTEDQKQSETKCSEEERADAAIDNIKPTIEKKISEVDKIEATIEQNVAGIAEIEPTIEKKIAGIDKKIDYKSCSLCSLSFRGERGLRRHMTMSHIIPPEKRNDAKTT